MTEPGVISATFCQKPVDDDGGAPVQSDKDYSDDRPNRLTGVTGGGTADVTGTTYDAIGNRTHVPRTGQPLPTVYTYDRTDRLTSICGAGTSLATNQGNARRTPVDDLRLFDQANRILQTKQPNPAPEVVTGRYWYDPEGKRTERKLCFDGVGGPNTSFP